MDGSPDSPRAIDWTLVRRRLRRPIFWIALGTLLLGIAAGATARPLLAPHDPPAQDRRFRFDEVYVVEESTTGNFTHIRIEPWVSNPSTHGMRTMQLIIHVIGPRNLVVNVTTLTPPALPGRRTESTAASFTIDNTKNYRIEVLALVDGLLVGKGVGSIGFQQFYYGDTAAQAVSRGLVADAFHYEYGNS